MTIDAMPILDGHTTFKEHLKAIKILNRRYQELNKVAGGLIDNLPMMAAGKCKNMNDAVELSKMVANESETLNRVLWKVVGEMFAMQGWNV